jgi:iron complex outermembrane receptor protein
MSMQSTTPCVHSVARRAWLLSAAAAALILGAASGAHAQAAADTPVATQTDDNQVEEVVVRGIRASLEKGLAVKRQASQVVESVVAEDIGKLPDNNVVEALQRVAGVQVTNRSGGEAAAISIRGMPDITTTWNGRNVFTASGRQFALQDIPANLVKRIDVYKTRSAEQIETGIAGQVDVATRRPFDFTGPALSLAARGIWHEQADKINPNLSGLVSNRWQTGDRRDRRPAQRQLRPHQVSATRASPPAPWCRSCHRNAPPAGWTPLERIQPTDARAPGQQLWTPGSNSGLPTAPGSTHD